ncbi:MAG: hypothetical protein MH204_03725 [Fimbriimonadaceae bacterium]|nr:hypothetical protein [Fimbriimonadaceae bacterium]
MARRQALLKVRKDFDLYLDSGDAIRAGNLSLPVQRDPVWDFFAEAELTAFCPGNRESHVLGWGREAKFRGCRSPIVCGNWADRTGAPVFPPTLQLEVRGTRIGVIAAMPAMVTERMKTRALSAYLWSMPLPTLVELAKELRPRVDLLIGLTHIGLRQDRRLAEAAPEIDMILGGHSHDVLSEPEWVGSVPIFQTGSHGRFWEEIHWTPGEGITGHRLHSWA